ncbi:hypothetical protein [Jannaschia rubra]|nr:hypothetical protein [Jannaschia rubra]
MTALLSAGELRPVLIAAAIVVLLFAHEVTLAAVGGGSALGADGGPGDAAPDMDWDIDLDAPDGFDTTDVGAAGFDAPAADAPTAATAAAAG